MTDSLSTTYQGPLSHLAAGQTRRTERNARLEEQSSLQVTAPSPQEASALSGFYNKILGNIDQLRYPAALPDLKAARQPAHKYYRGSEEEEQLKFALEAAKEVGNADTIKRARGNLQDYWKKIIDEECGKLSPSALRESVDDTGSLYRSDKEDPMTLHRLEALDKRASELKDTHALKDIERIRQGFPRDASPTGAKLAQVARRNAHGDGRHCLRAVSRDLEKIGIYIEGKSAYQAADQLASSNKVRELTGLKASQLKELPAGSVVVWNRNKKHKHGHISVSLGNGKEASDVIRPQIRQYGSTFRVFAPVDML